MAKTASEHIAFVDGGHFQRLQGGNRESKEADPQTNPAQGVRHNQPRKKLALILYRKGWGLLTNCTSHAPSERDAERSTLFNGQVREGEI